MTFRLLGCSAKIFWAVALIGCTTPPAENFAVESEPDQYAEPPKLGILKSDTEPSVQQPLSSEEAARLSSQLRQKVAELGKNPPERFLYADYLKAWDARVEQVGNDYYPKDARGVYGSVVASVAINADGSVASAKIKRSSGHDALDRAALRILELASPFQPFPSDMRRETENLVITRTFTFAPSERVKSRR